ncbi:hypothetical protein F5144DRAFT_565743 [Chaetomium tenue]|uniref:Uncharacterized protein n=1 Tax=Chaetomium tenue TaxID=1854479 RepID=A0ACB7PC58_9PEZI|nr:hypothetical protein F5144DRAFT_565743 [Chaetomium globosum]
MKSVSCECGKRFKHNNALNQHKRDAPKHQQDSKDATVDPKPDTSGEARDGGSTSQTPSNPLTSSAAWYSARYGFIQFVTAGESDPRPKAKKKKKKKSADKADPKPPRTDHGRKKSAISYGYGGFDQSYFDYLLEDDLNWGLCDKDCGWCGRCIYSHDI